MKVDCEKYDVLYFHLKDKCTIKMKAFKIINRHFIKMMDVQEHFRYADIMQIVLAWQAG